MVYCYMAVEYLKFMAETQKDTLISLCLIVPRGPMFLNILCRSSKKLHFSMVNCSMGWEILYLLQILKETLIAVWLLIPWSSGRFYVLCKP